MNKKYIFPNYEDVADNIYIQYVNDAQRTSEPHTHPFFQMFFLVKGKLVHHINNISADMAIGEMAIIPPNVVHHITLEDNPVYYCFSFNLSSLGKINSLNEHAITFLNSLENKTRPIFPKTQISEKDILHIQSLFEHIYNEHTKKEIGYKESIIAYSILLITEFIRMYGITHPNVYNNTSYTSEQMILNCIQYIDEHFTEELTIEKMSHMFALSQSTFCTCFKKITGMTFLNYLNHCRIKYAIKLIKNKYKIVAVSSFCGYNDFSTFSRNFKNIVGISPRDYQKTCM